MEFIDCTNVPILLLMSDHSLKYYLGTENNVSQDSSQFCIYLHLYCIYRNKIIIVY